MNEKRVPKWRERAPLVVLLVLTLSNLMFAAAHTKVRQHNLDHFKSYLLDPLSMSLTLPITFTVGLLGFNGDGSDDINLSPSVLYQILTQQYSAHTQSVTTLSNSDDVSGNAAYQMPIVYQLSYDVREVGHVSIAFLEEVLQSAMVYVETINDVAIFDIDALILIPLLDNIYDDGLAKLAYDNGAHRHTKNDSHSDNPHHRFTTIVVNPSKRRMIPSYLDVPITSYLYRYRYGLNSAPTQTFVSQGRYVFVDLSAGPVTFGPTDSDDGTVWPGSIPSIQIDPISTNVEHLERPVGIRPTISFISHLSSIIVSSIQHVFLSDQSFRYVKYSERLIIPIVVIRNHQKFNPFRQEGGSESLEPGASGPVNGFKIDTPLISSIVDDLVGTGTETVVVHGVHSIHDHPQLSSSIFGALKQTTVLVFDSTGYFTPRYTPYLDSALLMSSVLDVADELVQGLLDDAHHSTGMFSVDSSLGQRVLPVFIFSLLGLPSGILLDQRHLYVCTSKAVLVLQTDDERVTVPFITDDGIVTINAKDATRSIVAGLTVSLGAISPPFHHVNTWISSENQLLRSVSSPNPSSSPLLFTESLKSVSFNYMWSVGHHPFGPFNSVIGLSQIYRDAYLRNSLVGRITAIMRRMYNAVQQIDTFNTQYGVTFILTSNYTQRFSKSFIAVEVSLRLLKEVKMIEEELQHVIQAFEEYDFDGANSLSATVLSGALAFEKYVMREIEIASGQLSCCHVTQQAIKPIETKMSEFAVVILCLSIAIIGFTGLRLLLFYGEIEMFGDQVLHSTIKKSHFITKISDYFSTAPQTNRYKY